MAAKEITTDTLPPHAKVGNPDNRFDGLPDAHKRQKFGVSVEGAEKYRDYEFTDANGDAHTLKIDDPVKYKESSDGLTHRIYDKKGRMHTAPAPGVFACKIKWDSEDRPA